MARTTFPPDEQNTSKEDALRLRGVFLVPSWSISSTADVQGSALCPGSTPGAPLLLSGSRWSILYSGVRGQENGGKMTATEIYESMDACMEENKEKEYREVLLDIRVHAAELGRQVGRTEDDILSFYFKMSHLGDH